MVVTRIKAVLNPDCPGVLKVGLGMYVCMYVCMYGWMDVWMYVVYLQMLLYNVLIKKKA